MSTNVNETKGTENNGTEIKGTETVANVETIAKSTDMEVETMEKFNVIEELGALGYTESGVKSQKTTLLKKVLETELATEVKDIEEIGKEDLVKLLGIVMGRKSGRAELKENAKARLEELGVDVEEIAEKNKTAKKKGAYNCKELTTLVKTLMEEVKDLKRQVSELKK